MTVSTDLAVPRVALAVGAHPDDVEFGCGATLAKWAAAGCAVHLLVLTDGSKGSWEGEADTAALVETREAEQRAAATALGARDAHFLRLVDGELHDHLPEQERVCAAIRAVRPDVVLGHEPWTRDRVHPDHRHAGLLTIDGVVAARDPHFFPEQDAGPHRPGVLLLFETDVVNHVERLDPGRDVEAKIAALLCHRSQWRSTMGIDRDPEHERAAFEQRIRDEAQANGLRVGARAGEAFRRVHDL